MMRYNNKLGIVDISIQGMMVVGTIISALGTIVENEAVLFVLILQFFLGVYQISSGIIGAAKGRKWKIYYLIISIAYLLLGGVMAGILGDKMFRSESNFILIVFLGMVIPLLIGLTYFILSCLEYKNAKSIEDTKIENNILDADF